MHALPFTIKRAHFASLRLLRPFTLPHDLTPARFDLLYQLHTTRYRRPFQWRLAEALGVSRPTICKMIGALRRLGFIDLQVDKNDAHMRRIKLTRLGRKRFARALRSIRWGKVKAAVRGAWRAAGLSRASVETKIAAAYYSVLRYCRGLDERAELYAIC